MLGFIHFLFISALASRVLAVNFNIAVGDRNFTTTEILDIPAGTVKTTCASNCTTASTTLKACGDDATCLCKADTVAVLLDCEQCMFNNVVALNIKTDIRVGSQAVLAGYASACNSTTPLAANQTKLKLPDNWDGPFVAVLPVGAVAIAIITAVILGVSGITLVSTM